MLRPEHIFDGHNDAVTRYTSTDANWTFLERSSNGHLDLVRAREGGFVGGFFAIFPGIEDGTWFPGTKHFHRLDNGGFRIDPPPQLPQGVAFEVSERMFDRFDATVAGSNGEVVLVRDVADLDDALERGALAIIGHFEGAEAINSDLAEFDHFYERGLRSIGPVWSRPNAFGHGVPFAYPGSPDIGPGLTDAGFELVRECDRRGVVVDLAHLNEAGFWDVARTTTRPLVVTHTAAHAICPKPRNLTDRQIDAVGESAGVIGVTFYVSDIARRSTGTKPEPDVPTARIAEHIRYIADRIGPEHVAVGSDFDGAKIPSDMGDASGLGLLIDELRLSGFDDDSLSLVTHANWLKVLRNTIRE